MEDLLSYTKEIAKKWNSFNEGGRNNNYEWKNNRWSK